MMWKTILGMILLVTVLPVWSLTKVDEQVIESMAAAGKWGMALERVDQLLKENPDDAQARFLKGTLLVKQGNLKAAGKVFSAMAVDYPRLPQIYNNLAAIYAAQGNYEKARQMLSKAVTTDPDYVQGQLNLAKLYLQLAADAYDRASKVRPNDKNLQQRLQLLRAMLKP